MFERIIRALIYLCFLAAAFWLIVWVVSGLGIAIPSMVVHILGIVLVLVAILVLYRLFWPAIGNYNWWGTPPPGP
jgi:hypothetical protein